MVSTEMFSNPMKNIVGVPNLNFPITFLLLLVRIVHILSSTGHLLVRCPLLRVGIKQRAEAPEGSRQGTQTTLYPSTIRTLLHSGRLQPSSTGPDLPGSQPASLPAWSILCTTWLLRSSRRPVQNLLNRTTATRIDMN